MHPSGKKNLTLWGEGAIPQVLYHYWFLKKVEPGTKTEALLTQLVQVVSGNASESPSGLPVPYWDFEAVARHIFIPVLGEDQDPLDREAIGGRSYFVEALFHLLVRANRKQACIRLWPNVSRTLLIRFNPSTTWSYCLCHCERGVYEETQPLLRKEWNDLVQEARSIRCEVAPEALLAQRFLHALFVLVFPYRGTPDVIRALAPGFDGTWLIGDPIK